MLFEEYALRPDSCGPGISRGGLGVRYKVQLLRGEATLSVLGDRAKRGPFGVGGGGSAATARIAMVCGGAPYAPPLLVKDDNIPFRAGDTLTVETPGGGGYGDPKRRPRAAIEADLKEGYITPAYAARYYGTT